MCELPSPVAERDAQEDPADQSEEQDERHDAPEGGDALLQKLPAVGGLVYSCAHDSSSRTL
jgi:hypothetical protein